MAGQKGPGGYHGTHVAGTIAAARNGVGIVGVAPNVRLASVKVVNPDGFIYPEYAVCGFVWAGMKHLDVTNNSYFVDPFEFYCDDQPDQHAAKEAVRRAVNWSTGQGVVHAAAAGNSSNDLANKTVDKGSPDDGTPVERRLNSGCNDIPTELDGVVTVSSVQRFPANTLSSRLSSFSNRGLGVIDVAAPGSIDPLDARRATTRLGLRQAQRHLDGVAARGGRPGADEVGSPRLDPRADDREAAPGGRRQGLQRDHAGALCVGPEADNSYFGEGMVDALDAVS